MLSFSLLFCKKIYSVIDDIGRQSCGKVIKWGCIFETGKRSVLIKEDNYEGDMEKRMERAAEPDAVVYAFWRVCTGAEPGRTGRRRGGCARRLNRLFFTVGSDKMYINEKITIKAPYLVNDDARARTRGHGGTRRAQVGWDGGENKVSVSKKTAWILRL